MSRSMKCFSSIFHLSFIFSLGSSRNSVGSKNTADFKIREPNELLSNSFVNMDLRIFMPPV